MAEERKPKVVTAKIVGAKKATFANNVGIGVDGMLETELVDEVHMHSNVHVAPGQRTEVFVQMEQAILRVSDRETREQLLGRAQELEQSVGTAKFPELYARFVAMAADHWTLLAPFIPVIAKLFGIS